MVEKSRKPSQDRKPGKAQKPRQKWQDWEGNKEKLGVLAAWARSGKTDEEIAKLVGISRSTLSEWKKKHEGIGAALVGGKDYADRLVENSLHKLAVGYTVTNKKPIKIRHVKYEDGKKVSEDEQIEYVDETTHVPGDVRAIIFWLENRMPEWRKKYEQIKSINDDDESGAGLIVMDTEQAKDIKKMMEEAQVGIEEER